MKKALFPGSFDPPTLGHINIALRASKIFDFIYVAVGHNSRKQNLFFDTQERLGLLKKVLNPYKNIEVISFDGLVVDIANQLQVNTLVRSIRSFSDFDDETIQSQMNKEIGGVETIYMVAEEKYRWVSSSLIKEIAKNGRRLHSFIPEEIELEVFNRLSV